MQRVNLTDDELWQAIAHNTTAMSALVYRRLELDAGNARDGVIDRAQLMQSNLETISKLERKYREYTDELRRRYPAPSVIPVPEVEETSQVSRSGQRDCAEIRRPPVLWRCAAQLSRMRRVMFASLRPSAAAASSTLSRNVGGSRRTICSEQESF